MKRAGLFLALCIVLLSSLPAFAQWGLIEDQSFPGKYRVISMSYASKSGDLFVTSSSQYDPIEVWTWDESELEWKKTGEFRREDYSYLSNASYLVPFEHISAVLTPPFDGRTPLLVLGVHYDGEDGPNFMFTYQFINGTWQDIRRPLPANRGRISCAADAEGNLIFHGGWSGGGNGYGPYYYHKDTWHFDGSWSKLTSKGPADRYRQTFAFDAKNNRFVLFGGFDYDREEYLNDTWVFRNRAWRRLKPKDSPPAHKRAYMFFRQKTGQLLLYSSYRAEIVRPGFAYGKRRLVNEIWELDGAEWRKLAQTDTDGKPFNNFVYDSLRDRLIVIHHRKLYELRLDEILTEK